MLDVLLPSAYSCDLIFTGLPDIPKLGDEVYSQGFKILPGAGFIPAVALTRLGIHVDWICDFGNDFFSHYVLEEARRQNLSSHLFRIHDYPLQAISVAYSFTNDRAFLSYMDPLPPMNLVDLVQKNPARYLMFMSFQHGPDFAEVADAAHAAGAKIFVDGQVAGGANITFPQTIAALRSVDIFALNQKEALELTGENTAETALASLARFTSIVLIKLGPDGAIAQSNGKRVHMQGTPTTVVDTTGAGDNFNCGFLYGLLHHYSLENCLRCGNFCGSSSTPGYGGWETSPTTNQLESYLKANS